MECLNETNFSGVGLKRTRQKKKILNLLYNQTRLTGSEIGRRLGVSLPTALGLLNELMDQKYVVIKGEGESSGGRKPSIYGLAEDSLFVVACEIERYRGRVVLYNIHNQQITRIVHFDTDINDKQITDKILAHANQLIEENDLNGKRIFGIGVIMPGLIDEERGYNYTIKNKKFRNIKELLEVKSGKFVYVNNDARMQAHGEYIFGAARGHKNAIVVNWNWDIELGIIINGQLYNGSNSFAGEFSHIKLVEEGALCACGKRGCLETVASAYVLVNEAKKGIREGRVSQLTKQFKNNPSDLTPVDVITAAKSGDEFSIQLVHQVGIALGKGLAIAIQLLNPSIVVLGGPVSSANQFVLNPVQQSLNKYCLEHIASGTRMVISDLYEQSGLIGVTAMLYKKLFSEPGHLKTE